MSTLQRKEVIDIAIYYDDNFGEWEDMDEEDNIRFYQECQERSVEKRCAGCGRLVKILPHYAYCDSCATKREQGWDI